MDEVKNTMRIAIGCDHGGFACKEALRAYLTEAGHTVADFGCHDEQPVDYPEIAFPLAESVAAGRAERGILICTTGIGMCVAANKVRGVRCALCTSVFQAKLTRLHNDTNVLALGAQTITLEEAKQIAQLWLETPFSGVDRHARRVDEITSYEAEKESF